MISPVITYDKEAFKNHSSVILIEILEKSIAGTHDTAFYFDKEWVYALEALYKYAEKYQFKSFACKCLGLCLPLFFQYIGKYTYAAQKAMGLLSQMSAHDKADDRLFLALYIAMLTTPSHIQSRIGAKFQEIYSDLYYLELIIEILILFSDKTV